MEALRKLNEQLALKRQIQEKGIQVHLLCGLLVAGNQA